MTPVTVPSARPDRARGRITESRDRRPRWRPRLIRRYEDGGGRVRELIVRRGLGGSALVIDRDVLTGCDERLVAHLAHDEPAENAAIVSRRYLELDPARRSCRTVTPQDALTAPFPEESHDEIPAHDAGGWPVVPGGGYAHRLELVQARMSIPELRWARRPATRPGEDPVPVSLRDVIAVLESYEPLRAITRRAIARHRHDPAVSSTVLRAELDRVLESPIVLNRGLREAVLARVEREEASMSEIAIRCGRVKRDSRGNESGETSWLARRVGLLPEGGQSAPTPWVHSDVLGLIARRGLGISPREVELG